MRTSASHPAGPASQRAYDFAKWAILSAVYEGGDVITEGSPADEIGVSRTPAREALLRLEATHHEMRWCRNQRDTAGFTESDLERSIGLARKSP